MKGEKKKGCLLLTSDITHLWGDEQQAAFDGLIQALTSEPILAVADRTKPFQIHCDASGTGIGAVLYQEQEGQQRVIAYASRSLNKTESNYPAHKREFLALKWSMTEKFHDYILGSHVTVVTDNNPLRYILHRARLDAVSHRWLASLSIYDFDLQYKKGSSHVDADGLSRRHDRETLVEDAEYQKFLENTEFIRSKAAAFDDQAETAPPVSIGEIRALIEAKGINCRKGVEVRSFQQAVELDIEDHFIPAVEQVVKDPSLIQDDILEPKESDIRTISKVEWRKLQLADPTLRGVIYQVEGGKKLSTGAASDATPDMRVFVREQSKLTMREGVLYRKVQEEGENVRWQLVIPSSKRQQAMAGVHEEMYHPHLEGALHQARLRFFWPFMARDLERKIKRCDRCVRRGATQEKAPMESITTSLPLELLSIDYLTIDVKGQKQNILVILDHFTKFGMAVLTKDQKAKTVAHALWHNFFMIYGFPQRILSDQGRDFESSLLKEVCQIAGIKKCRTTPYHPAASPVERLNREIIHRLRSLEEEQKQDWRKRLPAVMHAYNCSIHSSTGYSPYYVFFGRHPRLPVDLAFGIDLDASKRKSPRQYVREMKSRLQEAYATAAQNMDRRALKNKTRYDTSAYAAELEVGDRVLVRRLGPRITSKVSDRWEKGVYIVVDKPGDMPVYSVRLEGGIGPVRTLHRNLLLPIGMIDEGTSQVREKEKTKEKPQRKKIEKQQNTGGEDEEEEQTSTWFSVTTPSHSLRWNATEFVPTSNRDNCPVSNERVSRHDPEESVESERIETTESGVESREESQPELPDDTRDSGQAGTRPGDDQNRQFDPGETDDCQDVETEEVLEDDNHDSSGEECCPPRRSIRQRRPVDRLNLVHRVVDDSRHQIRLSYLAPVLRELSEGIQALMTTLSWVVEEFAGLAKKMD